MIAILGSGFGLYGFLPALVQGCGQTVALPERYRDRFARRPELAAFAPQIRWFADEQAALEAADGVVLALRPADQAAWIPRCLALPNLQRLLLEKPLAPSPLAAAQLLRALDASGKTFGLNYSFAHLLWRDRLRDAAQQTAELTIDWQFSAHHFRTGLDTWKRRHSEGGGVIRFYGIHLIALLAELGYDAVETSRTRGELADEPQTWQALFKGPHLAHCRIHVDSLAPRTQFCITSGGETLVDLADPFDEDAAQAPKTGLDRRVPVLTQVALTLWQPARQPSEWYAASVRLWQAVEDAAQAFPGGARAQEGH
jgi:predicted dehydrogenase